jgi:nitrous-oxide reductase
MLTAPVAQAQDALAKRGKTVFQNRGCNGCHAVGRLMAGPDLQGVQQRRSKEWLHRWLKDTNGMLATDSTAKEMMAGWKGTKMPAQRLSDDEVNAILAYLSHLETRLAGK